MKKILLFICLAFTANQVLAQEQKLNVIVFGAHPDDCDIDAGGTAILYSKMGHRVKFVSLTNGDAGHHEKGGGELAKIRIAEAKEAGKRFGVEYVVLDNHDGELMPTLANRLKVIREIRKWNADIVIAPRPNDYHPDHRYTGILVQDAAYMVIVPNVAPEVPPLKKNPVFLYSHDRFKKPYPFEPDIAVILMQYTNRKFMPCQPMSLNFSNGCHGLVEHLIKYQKGSKQGSINYHNGELIRLMKKLWSVLKNGMAIKPRMLKTQKVSKFVNMVSNPLMRKLKSFFRC